MVLLPIQANLDPSESRSKLFPLKAILDPGSRLASVAQRVAATSSEGDASFSIQPTRTCRWSHQWLPRCCDFGDFAHRIL